MLIDSGVVADPAEVAPIAMAAASRDAWRDRAERAEAAAAAAHALADSEPIIVSGIRRDMRMAPDARGGEIRHYPGMPNHGMSGCPGDNLIRWFDDLRAALATDTVDDPMIDLSSLAEDRAQFDRAVDRAGAALKGAGFLRPEDDSWRRRARAALTAALATDTDPQDTP
jgi:hypothetical protein